MSAAAENRPLLQEQVGRSLNSEGPLEYVAAMGAAELHVHHGADRKGMPVSVVVGTKGHTPDPQDVLAAELASLLWHIRYAGQHGFVPRAAILFAGWMGYRGRFGSVPAIERSSLLHKLATRALHEWLSDRCIACGGSGKLERSPSGSWIRPRGSMQRNAVFRTCKACDGSRRQAVSHAQRVQLLGITRQRYDAERWDAHFKAALHWLSAHVSPRLNRPLTVQLERRKKRGQ